MSFIHNRTGIALCAAAIATVLLGTGCQKQSGPSGATAPTNTDAPSNPADATPESEIRWTEYRSDKLGITIPYPEGWYVEENSSGDSTVILIDEQPLPSLDEPSDATAVVGVTIGPFSLADAMRSYGSEVRTVTTVLGTRDVARLDYETELGASADVRARTVYLWEIDGSTIVVQGDADSPVLVRVAERLTSKPERR